jgi:hypothetical protein
MNPLGELDKLLRMFGDEARLLAAVDHLPAGLVPEPYRELLAHDHHMTVAMERFHGAKMAVEVLARSRAGEIYRRKILLRRFDTGAVVQFGLVHFDFRYVTDMVRSDLLAEQIPLGQVLINHNVLRHIDLGAVLRIECGPELAHHFACPVGTVTFGRMATIFCDRKPAVDLLEISAPLGELADKPE